MPSSYAVMEQDEMTYVDGGGTLTFGITISKNSLIIGLLSCIGGTLTVAQVTAALTAATATAALITAIAFGTAGLGPLYCGALLLSLGSIISSLVGFADV